MRDYFENYTEQELFEYQIWELELKIDAADTHLRRYKEENKHFKKPDKRPKGVDTIFYELNQSEWIRMYEVSLKQFEKDYGRKYNDQEVKHPKKGRVKSFSFNGEDKN